MVLQNLERISGPPEKTIDENVIVNKKIINELGMLKLLNNML